MGINIKDYVMEEFKGKVKTINYIKDSIEQLCKDTLESDEFKLSASEFSGIYQFKITYEGYEVKDTISYQEVYDWINSKDESAEYSIYEVIMSKALTLLRGKLDLASAEMQAKVLSYI